MATEPYTLDPDDALAHLLDAVGREPVTIELRGVRYRIEPEDPFAFYDPKKMLAAIEQGAGAFKDMDVEEFLAYIREARGHGPETDEEHQACFRRIVREAKPESLPTEYGEETRYGRDSYSNGRYNDALDDYEEALMERIDSDR